MSKTKIHTKKYKGEPSIILSNPILAVTVLPKRGGKIASLLVNQPEGSREVLAQSSENRYRKKVEYGRTFEGEDGSGFDDMFPNISPCLMTKNPWKGIELPDHGEIWSQPMNCTVDGDRLKCESRSLRLPAILHKTIRIEDNRLILGYRAENESPNSLPFQWAAHALYAMHPGSLLEVPKGMKKIINAYPGNRLSESGREYDYPMPDGSDGFNLSIMPDLCKTGAQKYWFTDRVPEGWCRLVHPAWNLSLTMGFSPESLPYLGIWVNEGEWNDGYNMGIEPSTCRGDDPVSSEKAGYGSILPPMDGIEWEVSISISHGLREL